MKLKSKLIGITVFGQALFAVIFFSALYFSYNAITEKIYVSSLVERYADDALDLYLILHLAESGDEIGVKESLNLKLDNYVYEIAKISNPGGTESDKHKAEKLLKKVARHRQTYPREPVNALQREVDTILSNYR